MSVEESEEVAEAVVTPWDVSGLVDYNKLIEKFGSSSLGSDLVERMERITGRRVHPLLRRGIFFSHRDLGKILDMYEAGKKFYLYTGRGPSSDALHLGHLIPFMFTQYLQVSPDPYRILRTPVAVSVCLSVSLALSESERLSRSLPCLDPAFNRPRMNRSTSLCRSRPPRLRKPSMFPA